ncbi:hypothetical protein GLOTRDRAFT_137310 [Gloeophyllum trabeum ATCC 11539]|uniref:Uncharacterized protein n=1 Tax=Gloeophyllum trabeum (strain ATCC 11539 / FP-39264 / Madison 617) TaxID=670483 RepID=S7QHD6_GLOTA|nr:uncharacterized protein GLOTRDRAFT_137310 [Gloeophyllum trabeum ATCC 11539]EPQ58668.1 hypothetical protein GLOTRDRAFT_137310 [Gloeophyllum trabeum ATCC 11539]
MDAGVLRILLCNGLHGMADWPTLAGALAQAFAGNYTSMLQSVLPPIDPEDGALPDDSFFAEIIITRPLRLPPPPPDPGPGDLWLQVLGVATDGSGACSRRVEKPRCEVYCELFMSRIPDPEPIKCFVDMDTYHLHLAVSIPIDSGLPHALRASPVVIVEKWIGWNGADYAPKWTSWEPGQATTFMDSRSDVAEIFVMLAEFDENTEVPGRRDEMLAWARRISVGTRAAYRLDPPDTPERKVFASHSPLLLRPHKPYKLCTLKLEDEEPLEPLGRLMT